MTGETTTDAILQPGPAPHRLLALADAMILVAAAALGMAVLRTTLERGVPWYPDGRGWYLRHFPEPDSDGVGPLGPVGEAVLYYLFFILTHGVPQLLVAALGIVALSVRRRRVPPIPLGRRPGFLLCIASVTTSAWMFLLRWPVFSMERWGPVEFCHFIASDILSTAAFTVVGSWIVLAIGGRAAPVPSRLDRVGYAVAASLVVLLVLDTIRMVAESIRLA